MVVLEKAVSASVFCGGGWFAPPASADPAPLPPAFAWGGGGGGGVLGLPAPADPMPLPPAFTWGEEEAG